LHQVARRLGEHYLPPMRGAHDARRVMNVQASIALSRTLWLARMKPHAVMHCGTIGPGMGSKRTLHLHCRGHRIGGACKGHEEGIALGVHVVPAPAVKGCTQELAALGEDAIIAVAYLLQEAGGAFDIGEKQGERSRRQFTHAAPLATRGTRISRPTWTIALPHANLPPPFLRN